MSRSLNETIKTVTDDYLEQLDLDNLPAPSDMEAELVIAVRDAINLDNQLRSKTDKLKAPTKLCAWQIADIMLKTENIVNVKCGGENADPEYDLLAIYQETGPNEGLYVTDENVFKRIAREYCYTITSRELKDVIDFIKLAAPRVSRTMDRDLIAVNNGIFNFETKILEPFSPDYVFLAKSKVNYNPSARNVVIHNNDDNTDWDVESWMSDLSDDPEVVQLLWEILSAIIRPHVRWNKSAWFYSNTGNNGKGTLCELMRSLCGDGSYACIPLSTFGRDFALEPLTRSTAIIVDENDVGTFIDRAANLKAVITNDVIAINRKFKSPISYQFYGFMVQCLNEFPRIKDKSDSFYRRQLFIPFDRCFTGMERKYIKDDYLHRDEVLEYVLYKVLHMDFYTLSEPVSCKNALEEYKDYNDPVRQFWNELENEFVWDILPFSFLYELYKAWFRKNSPSGTVQGKTKFTDELLTVIRESDTWECVDKNKNIRVGNKMDKPELLIATYGVSDWFNPYYNGADLAKLSTPPLKPFYRGLLRKHGNNLVQISDDE